MCNSARVAPAPFPTASSIVRSRTRATSSKKAARVRDARPSTTAGAGSVVTVNHRLNVFGYLHLADIGGPAYADASNAGHRDIVLAVSKPQMTGYAPDKQRLVDFMGSYPPGDMVLGELRGPMAEETVSWLNRLALGLPTQAATAAEAHNRLMLTKAFDLSARRKKAIPLPIEEE